MKKLLLLSHSTLRQEKNQFISFGVILLITALIFNLALTLITSVNNAYDKKFNELNTNNIYEIIPYSSLSDSLISKINNIDGVKYSESRKGIFSKAILHNFMDSDFEMNVVFYNIYDSHKLNLYNKINESNNVYQNGIYLPLYMTKLGGYKLDDKIEFALDKEVYDFKVQGEIEEMQYGNYGKGIIGVFLNNQAYNNFNSDNVGSEVATISIKTENQAVSKDVYDKISDLFDSQNIKAIANGYDMQVKSVRTIMTNIIVIILFSFALIILIVSLSLSKFRIKNSIEQNMASMGTLKAMGYTSKQIIGATILPYIIMSIIYISLGIAISYIFLPIVSNILTIQSGFEVKTEINVLCIFITFAILLFLTVIFTYTSARKIKKLKPINAIRGIKESGENKKNYFPISKTKGNINTVLALKNMMYSIKQNILLFLVLFFLTILAIFSAIFFYNGIIKPTNFVGSLSDEIPSVNIVTKNDIKEKISNMVDVKKVIYYTTENVTINNDNISAYVSDDFSKVNNDLIYEGRNPKNSDEIAVGSKLVKDYGYKIGDKINVKYKESKNNYTIVGFMQSVNLQGSVCELTNPGLKKLDNNYNFNKLYVYLDNKNIDVFITDVKNKYTDDIISISNTYESFAQLIKIFSVAIISTITIMLVVTLLIIFLILYVIIKSIIVQRKQEFGIYKAIGYTSKELILQLSESFMPFTIAAVFLSLILAKIYMPILLSKMFNIVGVIKINFEYPIFPLLIAAIILIVITFLLAILISKKIKKISAYSLIKE